MMRLPARRGSRNTIVAVALLYVLVTAGFLFFIYFPSRAELHRIRSTSEVSKGTLNSLVEMKQRQSAAIADYNQALSEANKLFSSFPRERNVSNILSVVQDLARSNGASLERLDYSRVEWSKGTGRMQLTALLTGNFRGLAETIVQLPQTLPTARVDDLRFRAVSQSGLSGEAAAQSSRDAGGVFPGLANSALVKALTSSMQITAALPDETQNGEQLVSPLDIDHLELDLKVTIWLMEDLESADIADVNVSGWYPKPAKPIALPTNSPFRPSDIARDLIEKKALADKLQNTQVKAIVQDAQGRFLASIWVLGKPYIVKVGDSLPELKGAEITAIRNDQVMLDVQGLGDRISLKLGGTKP